MEFEFFLAVVIVFSRVASFLFFFPLLKGRNIPNSVKVVFGMAISIPVATWVDVSGITTLPDLLLRVTSEVVFGLALAKLVEIIAVIPKMAGFMIDYDLGFSQVNLIDPSYGDAKFDYGCDFRYFFCSDILVATRNGLLNLLFNEIV